MKVTKELIESRIVGKYFYNLGEAVSLTTNMEINPEQIKRMGLTTHCVLVLQNGYTIVGHSACVDPAIYDEAVGQQYAYENAVDKIYALEGYVLANTMHEQQQVKDLQAFFGEEGDCDGCKI